MAKGRPKKYTKKALDAAIRDYFDAISRTVQATDDDGVPLWSDDDRPLCVTQYVRPPSVGGLCLHLGIDRSTWANYCDKELHPDLRGVTGEARMRMEAYLEEQLLTRDKGSLQGIIFNLQNNFGWKQKQEVELGAATRQAVSTQGMSIKEKLALLAEAQALREAVANEAGAEDVEDG